MQFYDGHPTPANIRREVLQGMNRQQKMIDPKFFYDMQGSLLFEDICNLPEYYPTRIEIDILRRNAGEIARLIGPDCQLIELGSGSSTKVRLLLDVLKPGLYIPVDISREHLLETARKLRLDYPWLKIHAACMDFTQSLCLPFCPAGSRKVVFFPGSSIGNFEPHKATELLEMISRLIGSDGVLLIGVDLKKDPEILNAAYNDSQGLTAAFNQNLLARINRELGADFNLNNYEHCAFYNESAGRIEMHLVSNCEQTVRIDGMRASIAEGESIHTENSYKYSIDEFCKIAVSAGLTMERTWTDSQRLFSVHCFRGNGESSMA